MCLSLQQNYGRNSCSGRGSSEPDEQPAINLPPEEFKCAGQSPGCGLDYRLLRFFDVESYTELNIFWYSFQQFSVNSILSSKSTLFSQDDLFK
eukprot:COSAG02_NODE_3456_length_6705_cov_54.526037_2_plen_93_part_00